MTADRFEMAVVAEVPPAALEAVVLPDRVVPRFLLPVKRNLPRGSLGRVPAFLATPWGRT